MLKGRIKTGEYFRIIVGDNLSATVANVSTAGSPGRSQLHLYRLPLDQDNTTRGAEPGGGAAAGEGDAYRQRR